MKLLVLVASLLAYSSGFAMQICTVYTNPSTGQSMVLCTGSTDNDNGD